MIFIDKCLLFGCFVSCVKFEKFLIFLEWVFRDRLSCDNIVYYLDDFLLVGKVRLQDCVYLMGVFREICIELGVLLVEDKIFGFVNCLVYFGLEINIFSMIVKIFLDKIQQLKFKLLYIL